MVYEEETNQSKHEVQEFMEQYGTVAGEDAFMVVRKSLHGIEPSSFRQLAVLMEISADELATLLGASERTFRNYVRHKKSLDPITSEHILKIASLYILGVEVFGNKVSFNAWLRKPSIAFDQLIPLELLQTPGGADLIKEELVSISYGDLA